MSDPFDPSPLLSLFSVDCSSGPIGGPTLRVLLQPCFNLNDSSSHAFDDFVLEHAGNSSALNGIVWTPHNIEFMLPNQASFLYLRSAIPPSSTFPDRLSLSFFSLTSITTSPQYSSLELQVVDALLEDETLLVKPRTSSSPSSSSGVSASCDAELCTLVTSLSEGHTDKDFRLWISSRDAGRT